MTNVGTTEAPVKEASGDKDIKRILAEPIPDKWLQKIDLIDTLPDRVVMQKYDSGRIKLTKRAKAGTMAHRVLGKSKSHEFDVAPLWRLVDKDETRALWTLECYLDYFENVAVRQRTIFNFHSSNVKVNGGEIKDMDLIDNIRAKKSAVLANRSAIARDRAAKVSRQSTVRVETIRAYLKAMATDYKKQRDIDEQAKKQAVMLEKEQIIIKARRQAEDNLGAVKQPYEAKAKTPAKEDSTRKPGAKDATEAVASSTEDHKEVSEMTAKQLQTVIENLGLGVDLKDYQGISERRKAVSDEIERVNSDENAKAGKALAGKSAGDDEG